MSGERVQRIQVPAALIAQIQLQVLNAVANAVVSGDYEGSEVISPAHKMIIGEMILTLSQNRQLETAKCEHCSQIRLEHELNLETGLRFCKPEHQPKPSAEDPTLIPTPNRFTPVFPQIITPPDGGGRIIMPGG